ncbi:uncharacterized protein F5147DRAFT_643259 [Suillus discolor]|uniref:Flavin reductase like domain-containing protein n=1 Tax=Suillus discolor TaxID=1912936 RepID=A0A9P7JNB5_9AGAM|nr:uncharacterized protein F5147DRAFT_643259 [Suillus discolor]KAG2091226.1 hypothetical protein F5147DRAFT_643259 [Suillus discolor]
MYIPPFDTTSYSTTTQSPNPSWTCGQRVDTTPAGKDWLGDESAGWKVCSTTEMDQTNLNKLLNSGVLPRPMSLVSTISEDGVGNLAPFSWFNTVMNYPPVISFAINHNATGSLKDTTANLKNGQGFAVNIISKAFIENANSTAVDAPPKFDEWALSGLTKEKCIRVQIRALRVKESMECKLYKPIDITHPVTGEHNSTLILAHVKYFHVRKDMLTSRGAVDLTKFKPVARVGDISYARVGDTYRIPVPSWAKEEGKIQEALKTLASP